MSKELFAALSKAQSEMHGAIKNSTNPFFKSSYADLESVWEAIREPLTKNGLSVVQTTKMLPEGQLALITTLAHSSGESIVGEYPILANDDSPQAIGSAITYARRYALAAIVGVHQTDDDGNAASKKGNYDKERTSGSSSQTNSRSNTQAPRETTPDAGSKPTSDTKPKADVPKGETSKDHSEITPGQQAELYRIAQVHGYGPSQIQDMVMKRFNCTITKLKNNQYEQVMEGLNK
jgi:hypothetical protein